MLMRILAPRRPVHAPAAGTPAGLLPGMCLSLTAHAALVVAVVGGDAFVGARAAAPTAPPEGERVRWVGVEAGSGAVGRARRPGTLPPLAYVIPGRGGPRAAESGTSRASGPAAGRDGSPHPARGAAERLAPALRRAAPRRTPPLRLPLPSVVLPNVALPEAQVTRLVAGVLAAAPDMARRVSRPEDFAPAAAQGAAAIARTGALALAGVAVHVRDVPIPLVTNPTPAYPAALAGAGIGGQVVVEFRIDSTGVVDPASLRVVESTNTLFVQAVRRVLPRLRFMPAQLGEHAVGVTVRQPFLFTTRRGL
jgi:protein TonB